jgi:hypothetical protein
MGPEFRTLNSIRLTQTHSSSKPFMSLVAGIDSGTLFLRVSIIDSRRRTADPPFEAALLWRGAMADPTFAAREFMA